MKIPRDRVCLYSSPFPEDKSMLSTIRLAAELGLGGVELMNFCSEFHTPDAAAIKGLAAEARARGLAIPCLTVGIDMLPDPDAAADTLISYAEICAEAGIGRMHHTIALDFSDPHVSEAERERRFAACLPAVIRVVERAGALGVQIIIENQGFVFNGVENVLRLRALTGGKIGLVADLGNSLFVDETPEAFIRAAGSFVVHVHVKDYAYLTAPVPAQSHYESLGGRIFADAEIGTGSLRLDDALAELAAVGYGGMYSLEFTAIKDSGEALRVLDRLC